jgi:hypothetical protein
MNRKITFLLIITLFFTVQSVFTQNEFTETELIMPPFKSVSYFAAVIPGEDNIPHSIRDNEFYLESLRLSKLAQDTFEFGDYDASAEFAEEAIRFAHLSDEYVAQQLIVEAKRLLDWADSGNIAAKFPDDYHEGKDYYEASVEALSEEEWSEATALAIGAIGVFTSIQGGGSAPLPRQYMVRSWVSVKDCLWNIAGNSWAYGDPWKWTVLYEANKSKFINPDNPNLIEPGMVLDIPSLKGEFRQGMWDSSKTYARH